MAELASYRDSSKYVRLGRQDGILKSSCIRMAALPSGPPARMASMPSSAGCFTRSPTPPQTHVMILTGTRDEFLTRVDFGGGAAMDIAEWFRIFKEGKDLLNNLLDIEVPVVAAVNGPAWVHGWSAG
jgi:hypothetical protein